MPEKSLLELNVGDLVTHVLMDKDWLGMVLKLESCEIDSTAEHRALVHINSNHVFSGQYQKAGIPPQKERKVGWVDVVFLKLVAGGIESA